MTARFRLPAGRSYNVRATELARDRQRTEVVCNILFLDNTVQPFKVNKHDQGQILLDAVFKHLELTERDYFGLHLADDSSDSPLSWVITVRLRICQETCLSSASSPTSLRALKKRSPNITSNTVDLPQHSLNSITWTRHERWNFMEWNRTMQGIKATQRFS
uniref:Tyrosine-protein phosphatase non-receptor type 4-like n=1 Tax=Sinocyclocheilus anshuiensis TaxID=1608454 RepID=A0A671KRP7_9TELE